MRLWRVCPRQARVRYAQPASPSLTHTESDCAQNAAICLDCAMRPMAMTHDAVAAIRQFQVLPHGDKGIGFGDQHLSQHSAGAFTCKFAQRIVDRLRLTECDDSGISRHGVSLLSGGSGRLHTRLDTPPSINRRHPDSGLAHASLIVADANKQRSIPGSEWSKELDAQAASRAAKAYLAT